MGSTKVKVPAKINLTLDVIGYRNGYHDISSLVCPIDLYDTIEVKQNKDRCISVNQNWKNSGSDDADDYVYDAAVKFESEYEVTGVDINVEKMIPVGAGLGGSSADAAGTLIAMKEIFYKGADIFRLAGELGSDTPYMTVGGTAVLSGRGDKVLSLPPVPKMYLIIILDREQCPSRESYEEYDSIGKTYPTATEDAVRALKRGDVQGMLAVLKNDLTEGSCRIVPNIKWNIEALKDVGAEAALMTGSGSSVYGIFLSEKERDRAYKELYKAYGKMLIKAETIK